jgi:hypothetical protein
VQTVIGQRRHSQPDQEGNHPGPTDPQPGRRRTDCW